MRTQRPWFPPRANVGGVQTQPHAALLSHARGTGRKLPLPGTSAWPRAASRAAPTRGIPAFASAPASLVPQTPRLLPPPRVSLARPRANLGSRLAAAPIALDDRDISAFGGCGRVAAPTGGGGEVCGESGGSGVGRRRAGGWARAPGVRVRREWRRGRGGHTRAACETRSQASSYPAAEGRGRWVSPRGAGRAPGDLRVGSCSERRGRRPSVGRGRVRGGRAEGVPGRSGPPGGVPQAGGGWREGGGRAGPRCHPEPGPGGRGRALEAAGSCLPECGIRSAPRAGLFMGCRKGCATPSRASPPPERRRAPEARGWTAAGEGPRGAAGRGPAAVLP